MDGRPFINYIFERVIGFFSFDFCRKFWAYGGKMVIECFRNFLFLFNQLTLVHSGSGSRGAFIFV